MTTYFFLISYDIVVDAKRSWVSKTLENHGTRVQKSVFECVITEREFYALKEKLERKIDLNTDSVRYYRLCRKCIDSVEVSGWGTVTLDPTTDIHRLEEIHQSEEWRKAEALRLTEIFGRAAKFFRQLWEEHSDVEAGWRYAHCLRRTGYVEVALGLLTTLQKQEPDHPDILQEYLWGVYYGRLRPANKEGRSGDVIAAAKDMVAAGAEDHCLKLAVFAVLGAAKTRGQWGLVSNWCDLLKPEELSSHSRANGKKSIPSDRERWYFAKLKALVKQEEWYEAQMVGEKACREFPENRDFLRWQAQALGGLGQASQAIALLESKPGDNPWYILADLAKFHYECEAVEQAWLRAVEAAKAPGQMTAKVNLWELMARISLSLASPEAAAAHYSLCCRIRKENQWPLRPQHQLLAAQIENAAPGVALIDKPAGDLHRACRSFWQAKFTPQPSDQEEPTNEREPGRIVGWQEGKSFAFIEPDKGGEQVFVLVKDLPTESCANRRPVSYQTIHHFDKRKNRQSLRAVNIEPLEGF